MKRSILPYQPILGKKQEIIFKQESWSTRFKQRVLAIGFISIATLLVLANVISLDDGVEGTSAVAAEHETCSQLGVDILKKGGSAVDAAITSTLCIGTINSFSSGIGGGGFMLVRDTDGTATTIDFRETAPAGASELMFKDRPGASTSGGLAVGVPGEIRGYDAAHKRYGKLPWSELIAPIIKLNRDGFIVSPLLATRLSGIASTILSTPGFREVYSRNGQVLKAGETCYRKALADTLETIAKNGADAFYTGSIADELVQAIRGAKGIHTKKDFVDYQAVVRPALNGTYHGRRIFTSDAPTSGPVLLSVLNILEGFNLTSLNNNNNIPAVDYHRIIESFKHGFAQRTELGDPSFVDIADNIQNITNKATAKQLRSRIDDNKTFPPEYYHPHLAGNNPHGTTHTTVLDQHGQTVSVMSTVNLYFGSRVISPSAGVILNNEMDDFSTPGVPNAFGLPPAINNFIRPGKRPLSSSVPIIVEQDGQVIFAAGASGGTRIITSVLSVLLNTIDYKMSLDAAINAPRYHHQLLPNLLTVESAFDQDTAKQLSQRGHTLAWSPVEVSQSSVQAIYRPYSKNKAVAEEIQAVSDGRKHGKAAGY
ncbi:gamma-glutamyltranspeptidase [Syncephalis fuscata]|nr:gamma-glutamyltranspeptidase [Syncephalis fuscata]